MDPVTVIAVATVGYLGGSVAVHRLRLARHHRDGLELTLLRRVDAGRLPPETGPVLDALARAEAARAQGDAAAREREARIALAELRHIGGPRHSAGLAYLDAQIRMAHLVTPLNIEVLGVSALLALKKALNRFGPTAELHLGLAHAHALLGQTGAALDELGRAVYYAHGAPFYTELVLASEYVERVRPRLRQEVLGLSGEPRA